MPEYEWAGGLMDRPIELITGEVTGLPFPARAEIVLEGEISPTETTLEGPFGEWHGYYAGEAKDEPVIRIKRIYHRNDPILTCAASNKAAAFASLRALLPALGGAARCARRRRHSRCPRRLAASGGRRPHLLRGLDQAALSRSFDASRAVASQVASVGYISRWIVVVDDDVDPTDIHDVIWAMGTRCDPKTRTTMLDNCWSSRLDTMVFDYAKLTNSRMVIDACKPVRALRPLPQSGDDLAGVRREDPREVAGAVSLVDLIVIARESEAIQSVDTLDCFAFGCNEDERDHGFTGKNRALDDLIVIGLDLQHAHFEERYSSSGDSLRIDLAVGLEHADLSS